MSSAYDFEKIDSRQFEDLVEQLIRKMGFITKERKRGPDGGIDILAINQEPIFQGIYIIQCKRYSHPIGVGIIRDLYGVVHSKNANKGILITNSYFTIQAIKFAEGKQLELINGDKLRELLSQYELLTLDELILKIPSGVSIFLYSFGRPFKELYKQFSNIEDGFNIINRKIVYPNAIEEYWINTYIAYEDYKKSVNNILKKLNNLLFSDENEIIDEIKSFSKLLLNSINKIFSLYKKGLGMIPSNKEYKKVYLFYLDAFKQIFLEWNRNIVILNNLTSDADYNDIKLSINFDLSENYFNQFLNNASTAYLFRDIRKTKKGCFIVTAVYGTSDMAHLPLFYTFRDIFLNSSNFGRKIVKTYYQISPPFATFIRKNEKIRSIIRRLIIDPIYHVIKYII